MPKTSRFLGFDRQNYVLRGFCGAIAAGLHCFAYCNAIAVQLQCIAVLCERGAAELQGVLQLWSVNAKPLA